MTTEAASSSADPGKEGARNSKRAQILEAARRFVEREGADGLSLDAVAGEANFAPSTVYAYFVNKTDLVLSVVAEDLAAFARHCDSHASVANSVSTDVAATAQDQDDDALVLLQETTDILHCRTNQAWSHHDVLTDLSDEEAPAGAKASAVRSQGNVDNSAAMAKFEARIAALESRQPDAWLERRLREFEKMQIALEERLSQCERATESAGAAAEENAANFERRLEAVEQQQGEAATGRTDALGQQVEASETRLRQAFNDLRMRVLDMTGRLEAVERAHEAQAQLQALSAEAAQSGPDLKTPQDPPASLPEETKSVDNDESDPEASYLAAARRAAQAAQTLTAAERDKHTPHAMLLHVEKLWNGLAKDGRLRSRLLLGACISLGVVVTGAGVALKQSETALALPRTQWAVSMPHRAPSEKTLRSPLARQLAALEAQAKAGRPEAMLEIGLAELKGVGNPADPGAAAHWIMSAALRGEPVAEYWLGTLYEHGRGESLNPSEAARWYEAAALQGNLKATEKLGVLYAEGSGLRQNYAEAARWFSRAAETGFVNAQYNLGVLYERGLGVPQSLLDAYKWYALAAAQGDKDSATRLDILIAQASSEDLASARDAVAAFKPQTPDPDANAAPELLAARNP